MNLNPPTLSDDDFKLVNCAACGMEMAGERHRTTPRPVWPREFRTWPLCAGRHHGRPYCGECLGIVVRREAS
jgi:hypothetical protein